MSEVYVLVKQVPGRPNGEVTLHGVSEDEGVANAWEAASEECSAVYLDTNDFPTSSKWELLGE